MAPPRRPWVAALLSFLAAPGLGYLYSGRAAKALVLLLGWPLVGCLAAWAMMRLPLPPLNIVLPLLALLAGHAWFAVDAARDARKGREAPRPWYSRWFTLLAVFALYAFLLVPAWKTLLFSVVQSFKIPTGAMERTVLAGDYLLSAKMAFGLRLPLLGSTVFGRRTPQRGDIVVFLFPEDRERIFLKRAIGLPGETIEVRGRTVSVNGSALTEPYAHFIKMDDDGSRGDWGPQQVPAGHLFVLGDNRDNSRDSRFWGFVPETDVLGLARVVYFSWDPRTRRVRWERIGQRLR